VKTFGRLGVGLIVGLAVFGSAPAALAQALGDTPGTSTRVRELLQAVGVPPPASAQGETVDLGLEESVALALERNLDIAVERLNPSAFDFSLAALRAQFNPTLTSNVGQNNTVNLPTSQLVGGNRVTVDALTYNFGGQQSLPWGGGSYQLSFNNRKQDSDNRFITFNPQFNTTLQASIVQPLLRNFRTDNLRTQLRVTAINRDISEIQLRQTVTNILANVRNAYWDLVFATQAVDVARRSLQLADKLVEDNKIRVEVGTLAPIDVVQAEAEAATRRQVLAQLEAQAQTAELSLKRLIVSGTDDPRWRARLNPTDRPSLQYEPIDLEAALGNALASRTDLAQSKRSLEVSEANLSLLKNQSLPSANLVANYGLQGIGGTLLNRDGQGGPIISTVPGGYGDALAFLRDREFPTWNVSLQVSYPIGTNPAEANYQRARITLEQSRTQLRQVELNVATQVTNAALQVEANWKRVEASRAARELAQRRLEAEQSKFEVGLSTNFFVVQAQRDLADAENIELRAVLDYRKSLVDFERVQQTSLGNAGISINTGGGNTGGTTGGGGLQTTGGNTGGGQGSGIPGVPGGGQ
jgi:outer membrane protein TolC